MQVCTFENEIATTSQGLFIIHHTHKSKLLVSAEYPQSLNLFLLAPHTLSKLEAQAFLDSDEVKEVAGASISGAGSSVQHGGARKQNSPL